MKLKHDPQKGRIAANCGELTRIDTNSMTLYGLGMNTETPTDSPEFTVRECLQFVERYRANEYIPPAKAKNWTIALKSLSFGDEDQDVRQMEMDDLVLRYINEGASPETATAYGQRAIRCRLVFLDYKKNPKAFKPVTARKLAPRNTNGAPERQLAVSNGVEQLLEASFGQTRVKIVVVGIPKPVLTPANIQFIQTWLLAACTATNQTKP